MKFIRALVLAQLFLAPDGPGAGGSPPETPALDDWIKWLNKTGTKEEWHPIVKEMAKAFDLKVGEAYEKLAAAGWKPINPLGPSGGTGDDTTQQNSSAKKQTVTLRHKTPHPLYRRAGLLLTQLPKDYEVTAEQLAALKKDSWVEIVKK